MFSFLNKNEEKQFWDSFLIDYSKLIYFNIRKTFDYYNFIYQSVDIEDCYHEIIIKIMENKKTIFQNYNSEKSKFSTYLSAICFNKIVDFLNKEKFKYNIKNNEESIFQDENLDVSIDLEKMLNNSQLSDRERLILKLSFFKELKSNEIADILNIQESTVRVTKKKALDKIKRKYNDQ